MSNIRLVQMAMEGNIKSGVPKASPYPPSYHCSISFNGLICRKTCAAIAVELIKYTLLQRDQIPGSFDVLNRGIVEIQAQSSSNQSNGNVAHDQHSDSGCNATDKISIHMTAVKAYQSNPAVSYTENEVPDDDRLPLQRMKMVQSSGLNKPQTVCKFTDPSLRKQKQNIQASNLLFRQLEIAFQSSAAPIKQMAFVLGSSPVTPRESFLLTFPSNTLEGENLSLEAVKSTLFRKLITSDFLGSFGGQTHSCTKLFVFLYASRDSGIKWFYPNVRFAIPKRGHVYNIELVNEPVKDTSIIVSDTSPLEISGVAPLFDTSNMDLSSPSRPPFKRRRLSVSFEETFDHDECIWYQAPIVFNGFK